VINTENGVWRRHHKTLLSSVEEGSLLLGFRRRHKGGDMKKQALSLVGVLGLLLAAGSAMAQTRKIVADVPFNFIVNGTTMPSGPYSVVKTERGNTVLIIRNESGKAANIVTANAAESAKPADETKLVFHCYSGRDHCFLYQVWVQGMKRGQQLPKTSLEKELAANISSRDIPIVASIR
jgi:hypothetical protein